jgi:hypothetical protein
MLFIVKGFFRQSIHGYSRECPESEGFHRHRIVREAYDHNIKIPDDLSVVGFDDIRLPEFTDSSAHDGTDVSA